MKFLLGLMMTLFLCTVTVAQEAKPTGPEWMAFGLMGLLDTGESNLLHSQTTWKTESECDDFIAQWLKAMMAQFVAKKIDPTHVMLDGRCLNMGKPESEGNPA